MLHPTDDIFVRNLAYSHHIEGDALVGEVVIDEVLRTTGGDPRIGYLAIVGDMVASSAARRVTCAVRLITADLRIEALAPSNEGLLMMRTSVVKAGRTLTVAEAEFREPGGRLIAHCLGTFTPWPTPPEGKGRGFERRLSPLTVDKPLADFMGVRQPQAGVAELDLTSLVSQSYGTIHGGAVTLLAELAAESLTATAVRSLDVRFTGPTRQGPAVAQATALADGFARVELRDRGYDERLVALALART